MYIEYLNKEAVEEVGNFQLGQVFGMWGMLKYLLKEK